MVLPKSFEAAKIEEAIEQINNADDELADAGVLIEQLGKREIDYHSTIKI